MQKCHLSNPVQCNMDGQTWMLLLIVFTFKGNSELSQRNTLCPSVCICDGKTAICKGHDGSHLRYIPPLPENITSLVFNSNDLGYMGEKAFNYLSNLHLTRLDLRRSRIGFIHKKAFRLLPHLQFLDLSENKFFRSRKLENTFTDCKIVLWEKFV